MLSEFNHF